MLWYSRIRNLMHLHVNFCHGTCCAGKKKKGISMKHYRLGKKDVNSVEFLQIQTGSN